MLTQWESHQLASFSQEVCDYRNQNTAADVEKIGFELEENGVLFKKLVYRVDSTHVESEMPMLRVEKVSQGWSILVPHANSTQEWQNASSKGSALYQLFDQIKFDTHHQFWG